jgi:hypothetical protein
MELIARNELALAQVSGGSSKGGSTSNTSSSNSVVVISQGGATATPTITLPGLSIK